MLRNILTLVFSLMAFGVPAAFADPIVPTNTRPVPVTIPSPDGAGTDLQTILDAVYPPAGTVSATTDQQAGGMWASATPVFPTVTPVLSFEYAGNASSNALGFWFGTDTGSLTERTIFYGPAGPGVIATIAWSGPDSGTISQGGVACLLCVDTGAFSGIPFMAFGFFLDGPGGKFYTVDQLNPGGAAQALAYHGTGGNATNWVIAFEELAVLQGGNGYYVDGPADKDYNDFVFRVESVNAIPEPEIYAMMVAGLGLMGFIARRRKQQLLASG
jgi:hypothetical protein